MDIDAKLMNIEAKLKDIYEFVTGNKKTLKENVNAIRLWEAIYGVTAALTIVYAIYIVNLEYIFFENPKVSILIHAAIMLIAATMSGRIFRKTIR